MHTLPFRYIKVTSKNCLVNCVGSAQKRLKMSKTEVEEKINLNEIIEISEDEFKKQILSWIDEHGLSRKLQSKLRADLFEQFNRTKLGRQMTEQHQLTHRMVLSPLILVLNTLVAEFLYTEDCHFTLSVFANEVPYKNTLPNFEATPSGQLFQFSQLELNDIFEAIGFSKKNVKTVREFYTNRADNREISNKSLLYCIMKSFVSQIDSERSGKMRESSKSRNKNKVSKMESNSSQQSTNLNSMIGGKHMSGESFRRKYEHLHISSRYFKYLNRYLDILSERINDMSKSLAEKRSDRKAQKQANGSSEAEESLKRDLRKIIENINKLTKSEHKSRRFQCVLNSIERLSAAVEQCNGKLEDLLKVANAPPKASEPIKIKSMEPKVDCFSNMDYGTWLRELKTSEHGRKFIDRLEASLQKTMEKERENLEKLYEEKSSNYRMLIRLHYKQKYDANKSEHESVGRTNDKEDSSPIDKLTPDSTEKLLAESLAARALEKEQQVDQIVQSAKLVIGFIFILIRIIIFFRFLSQNRARLQQLERESEELDQSFQAYLRRQQLIKQQMNDDASKIWQNYSLSKAALAQYDKIDDKDVVYHSNLVVKENMDKVVNSTFQDDVDIEGVLKDLNEIKRLKSPTFDKNGAFANVKILPSKLHGNKINTHFESGPAFDFNNKMFNLQVKDCPIDRQNDKFSQNGSGIPPRSDKVKDKEIENVREREKEEEEEKMTEMESLRDRGKSIASTFTFTPVSTQGTDATPNTNQIDVALNLQTKQQTINLTSNGNNSVTENTTKSAAATGNAKENGTKESDGKQDVRPTERADTSNVTLNNGSHLQNAKIANTNNERGIESTTIESKINGFSKSSPLKVNGSHEMVDVSVSNGFKPTIQLATNGLADKLTKFSKIGSESEGIESDSEHISIGAQRIIKSPDDFWI